MLVDGDSNGGTRAERLRDLIRRADDVADRPQSRLRGLSSLNLDPAICNSAASSPKEFVVRLELRTSEAGFISNRPGACGELDGVVVVSDWRYSRYVIDDESYPALFKAFALF